MTLVRSFRSLCLAMLFGAASACLNAQPPLGEATKNTIGYPSVAAAETALRSQPGVIFTDENGWTIATDRSTYTIWSFAPSGHPAYPALIKRQIISRGSGQDMAMNILCEASKPACDELVQGFMELNERARASLKAR